MTRRLAFSALIAAALLAPAGAAASFPGRNGLLAYSTAADGERGRIFTVTPEGGRRRALTSRATVSRNPAWSSDGRTIAFDRTHKPGGPPRIFLMAADGSNERALPMGRVHGADPTWAPSGGRLAFEGCGRAASCDSHSIWAVGRRGRGLRRVAEVGTDPVWSPDGRWIAYYGPVEGGRCLTLVLVRPSGADRHAVVPPDPDSRSVCSGGGTGADFSPDGRRLVYFGLRHASVLLYDHAMYTIGVDGSGRRAVRSRSAADTGFYALPFVWSPDGDSVLWRDDSGSHIGPPGGGRGEPVAAPADAGDWAWQSLRG